MVLIYSSALERWITEPGLILLTMFICSATDDNLPIRLLIGEMMAHCSDKNDYSTYGWIRFLGLIILGCLIIIGQGVAKQPLSDHNSTIKIAIFRMSPEVGNFTANHATIEEAIHISSENGANWFITPEMAESGYEFTDYSTIDQLPEFPSSWLSRLETISREENITLFIGFPQRLGNNYYNSVAVINRNGNISGIHQKTNIMPGTHEGWATPGNATPLEVDNLKIGYYICADAADQNITNRYIASEVDIMLSSAAWYPDPNMGPEPNWKNITLTTDVPLVIANTAGKKGKLDFTHANSGVFQNGRELYQIPGTEQGIAFVDWNYLTGEIKPEGEEEVR